MLSHRSFYITLHFTFINYYSRNQSYELHMLEHVAATQCSPQLLECRLLIRGARELALEHSNN